MSTTWSIRTARVPRACDTFERYAGCTGRIEAGSRYRRSVAFPGDVNASNRPWVLNECKTCALHYSRWDLSDLFDQFQEETKK